MAEVHDGTLLPARATHLGLALPHGGGQGGGVSAAAASSATILVLEEDAAVQELIDQALRDSGHRVLSTKNALEALEVVQRVRIDILVVGDLLEPRQTVVDDLRTLQPTLAVVGICSDDDGDELRGLDSVARLSTPFSLDELCVAVASARRDRGL
jgi:CheY-like chemotaxis protein